MCVSSTYMLRMHKHTRHCQPQINPARTMSSTYYILQTRKHTRYSQPQINPARIMSSTYELWSHLWMHQHNRLNQPRIIPVRTMSSTYHILQTQTHESASDQPRKKNAKHVHPANAKTHATQSASDQPNNCQTHTACERANTCDSVSLRST